MDGNAAATPPTAKPPAEAEPDSLLAVLRGAVVNMAWLKGSDAAMVALAERYAHSIDAAFTGSDAAAASKVLGWMGPHLANILRDLGGAPSERLVLSPEKGGQRGRLAHLRSARQGDAADLDSSAS